MKLQHRFQEKESHYPSVHISWDFHLKTGILKVVIIMQKEQMA